MDFRLGEDQRALRKGVRELLGRLFDREALRAAVDSPAVDRGLWRELGAAGFFALRLPEEEGGVGLGLPEAVLVFEEAGRVLGIEPVSVRGRLHRARGLLRELLEETDG